MMLIQLYSWSTTDKMMLVNNAKPGYAEEMSILWGTLLKIRGT